MSEVVETDRKLATIRQISAIDHIPDADAIDVATVDGWKVVVKKGDFSVGDLCVYFEIDSWVPATVAPFLNKGRKFNDVEGERLRTKKLRGQISQGLILPLSVAFNSGEIEYSPIEIGDDMTEILGIQKFEKPIPASLQGVARGNFPSFIRKTDQERIQNLKKYFKEWAEKEILFEISEKCDGSSMTSYFNNGVFGVCSRNLDLVETEGNAYWNMARKLDLEQKFINYNKNIAIQGELCSEGIQGNKYGLKEPQFFLFDVVDIDRQKYFTHKERIEFAEMFGLQHVPVLSVSVIDKNLDIEDFIKLADGVSLIGKKPNREGLVYKNIYDGNMSFKVISNEWLIKFEE